jgi:hypothetical protein
MAVYIQIKKPQLSLELFVRVKEVKPFNLPKIQLD